MTCEPCKGRGWVPHPTRTAVVCSICGGRAELSWGMLARKLGENPRTLARVRQGRSKSKTCMRVLVKVAAILWPDTKQKQKEMFT